MLFTQGWGDCCEDTLGVKKHRESVGVKTMGPQGKQECCSGSHNSRCAYAGSHLSENAGLPAIGMVASEPAIGLVAS